MISSSVAGSSSASAPRPAPSPSSNATASLRPVTSWSTPASTLAFFGSSARPRWNEAAGGNSSTSRSPSSATGRASARTEPVGIDFSDTVGRIDCFQAAWISLEVERRALLDGDGGLGQPAAVVRRSAGASAGCGLGGGPAGRRRAAASLELLQPVGGRLAGEVGAGPRHLDERELERKPRIAALPDVVDGDVRAGRSGAAPRPRRAGWPASAAARASPASPGASPAPRPCAGRGAGGAGARAGR